MKANEIREMTESELNKTLKDLKSELFNLRFQLATNQLSDTSQLRKVRKSIARVKTTMKERELNINRKG